MAFRADKNYNRSSQEIDMHHTKLTLAILLSFAAAGAAQAQSNVTIYGRLDAGLEYTTNANAAKGSMTRVQSGGMNTARWGILGREDLGNGLTALINLEGGIVGDTGASDGVLFKRQATVGLEGAFGRVVMGRSFTTVYDFVIGGFDPLGFAPDFSWGTSAHASGPSKYGMTTAFDNLIKYEGKFGAFRVGATVGAGEQSSGAADSRKVALGTIYTQGPLSLLATFEQINGNTVAATNRRDETTAFHLGANYVSGAWRFTAAMRDYKLVAGKAATADVRADTYWAGVNYLIAPAVTLTGAVYYVDVKNVAAGQDADPVMYVARAKYALSKRTDLYLSGAYSRAKNGKLTGLSRDDAGFGSTQAGLMAGIQHRF
jgi:predicted porin